MKTPAALDSMNTSTVATPIAVVGLGALFPGSTSVLGYWRDIMEGRDRLTEVPRSHWLKEDYFDPKPGTPDKVYATRGGFMSAIDFSPLEFGMPPNAVPSTDTAQLLALVVAKRVLMEATRGKYETVDRSRMSVVLGVASATELVAHMSGRLQRPVWEHAMRQAGLEQAEIARVSQVLDGCYVPWQESTFPGLLGNVVAGRITNRLDLGGTNAVVDAACAGSLAAISMAVNDLALRNSDLVITGGVDALNDILMYMCFAQTGALSLSGDCRPFSDQSDGTMLGEGIGMLALRRLDDAERDGDAIYAVIRGIGSSSDGRAKSIYAPSAQGQTLALTRAYEHAGYGPQTVGLVEAHGTGTLAGDAAEFEALRTVFEAAATPIGHCALGSVKAQLGHTKAAAGAAGMIKAVLALHHKVLPPTIKVQAPNPKLSIEDSPFYLNTETRPWIQTDDHPRRASVSALGFGGTNFHVALEEYTGPSERPARLHTFGAELVLLSADTPEALATLCRSTATICIGEGALVHLARRTQLAFQANHFARVAIVARDEADLRDKLHVAADRVANSPKAFTTPGGSGIAYGTGVMTGDVAFLFPGQGSQYVGMGSELTCHFPLVQKFWDHAAAVVQSADPPITLAQRVFPTPVFGQDARTQQSVALTATQWAQPAILATSLAMMQLLEALGVKPTAVAGHSLGEITACVASGLFDPTTGLHIARRRGEFMASAGDVAGVKGAMTAAISDPASLAPHLEGIQVVLANHNSPTQVVLSGALSEIEKAEQKLETAGITVKRLPVSTAFHSPLVQTSVAPFEAFLASIPTSTPHLPCYANATAALYPVDPQLACAQLANAIALPVRFAEQIEAMYAAGIRTFIEVGPDAILSKLTERTLEGRPHLAVALDQKGKPAIPTLLTTLGRLAAAGLPLQFASFWTDQQVLDDPASQPSAKFSIKLNGANYGKPYPPAQPVTTPVPTPVIVQAVARSVSLPQASPALSAPSAPASTPTATKAPAMPTKPIMTSTTPRTLTPTATLTPTPTPTQQIPVQAGWIGAVQQLQAPTIAAQMEFQRLMVESHMAFLRAIETSYAALGPSTGPRVSQAVEIEASRLPSRLPSISTAPEASPTDAGEWMPAPTAQWHNVLPVAVAATPPAVPPVRSVPDLTPTLLAIVAEKTGYPIEMIDTAMDMESDLGIDSIKRVEILSAMRRAVPHLPEVATATMAATRTLAQIIALMGGPEHVASRSAIVASTTAAPTPNSQSTPVDRATVDRAALQPILLTIVADKTGYPVEMIDTAMDMEADLGIDSIKRVEILSAMRRAVPDLPQVATAKMAATRTLAEIINLMGADATQTIATPAAPSPAPSNAITKITQSARRLAIRVAPAPATGFGVPFLFGKGTIYVTSDGGSVASHVISGLHTRGVNAAECDAEHIPTDAAGVLFLGGLRPLVDEAATAINREAFHAAQAVAPTFFEKGGLFVTVQDTSGDFGLSGRSAGKAWFAGLAALAKTAAAEWPLATAKAIDIERAGQSDAAIADRLLTELFAGGPELEVGLALDGTRNTLIGVSSPAPMASRPVAKGAVFVVTGGARGVTAASLMELGRLAQPRFLILGRTPLSSEEPIAFRGVADEAGLKRVALTQAKAAGRSITPKEVSAETDAILAAREVRRTLADLVKTGSAVRYEAIDVRDVRALQSLFDDIRHTWGPIQGLVHGAGVLADATIDKKTDAQFNRVFDTKVEGLRALLAATQQDPLQWICLFSSVAARGGNAGQCDYAMANEILNKVAAVEAKRRGDGCRVVAIGWGPWDGGMVTPTLRSHFLERNVALLPIALGADAFVRELCVDPKNDTEVVIGGAHPHAQHSLHETESPRLHSRVEVFVDATTHPYLASHKVQGKIVLPMVVVMEWFARLARAIFPERTSVQLRDLRVVRGVTLTGFDSAIPKGDRFTVGTVATQAGAGLGLELRDNTGAIRYTASIEPSSTVALAEPLNGAELTKSPWDLADCYSSKTLFHGKDFRVLRSVDGLSSHGARATLAGTADVGWPGGTWETDPAAMDGGLQLAILCGLNLIGPTLPLRIGKVGFTPHHTAVSGPIRCALFVRSHTPERMVCDIALTTNAGAPLADLVEVEMYAVPSGNIS